MTFANHETYEEGLPAAKRVLADLAQSNRKVLAAPVGQASILSLNPNVPAVNTPLPGQASTSSSNPNVPAADAAPVGWASISMANNRNIPAADPALVNQALHMERIKELAKLEKEEADREIFKYQSALDRQTKADEILAPLGL